MLAGRREIAAAIGHLMVCLVLGHRWDVAPARGASHMKCVRCGMTAEPVSAAAR